MVEIDEKGEEVFVIEGSFSDELGVHRSWSWCRSWLKIEGAAWVAVARDRNMVGTSTVLLGACLKGWCGLALTSYIMIHPSC